MTILETTTERIDERPEAVFFEPEENLFSFSESYFQAHNELLSSGSGVIYKQHEILAADHGHEVVHKVNMLIFDATQREQGRFIWQLSTGEKGSRTITQVAITESGIEGHVFTTDSQGALRSSVSIEEDGQLEQLWGRITDIISSRPVAELEAQLLQDKQAAIDKLVEFVRSKKMIIDIPSFDDRSRPSERREVIVDGEGYMKQYDNLSESVSRVGFTVLRAFRPPEASAVDSADR
ncbi:MAG TPA: hypothetical protein VIH90_00550 [Candidatus Saccharimonadales bacterium]